MSKIIMCWTQKGGVGKTVTALNLAAALLESDITTRVRLLDLDAQESLYRYRRALGKRADFHAVAAQKIKPLLLSDYDYTLLDCPPNFEPYARPVMALCDVVLVPVQTEYDPLVALVRTADEWKAATVHNKALQLRVLLTMFSSVPHCRAVRDTARAEYGQNVCKAVVPFSRAFGAAAMEAKSILQYAPESMAAKAYRRLASEVKEW